MRLSGLTCSASTFGILLLANAAPALAVAPETFKVDNVHSTVIFRIHHLGAGYSYGRFNKMSGKFTLDEENPEACTIDVTVKADSVDTADKNRDKHLEGPDFFNVKQYPDIKFKSTSWKKTADRTYEVAGDLSFHGVTKPITLKVEHTGTSETPRFGRRAGLETTFTVSRSEFGVSFMPDGLSDEVRLTVAIEGQK